jgi:hypothetical protein
VLVIGQDPAQHETIVRRILVGEAGHRVQGFLGKLGIDSSYVMVNAFLYSMYGTGGSSRVSSRGIAAYRNRWLSSLFDHNRFDAVVALGTLADRAWNQWKRTDAGADASPRYVHITHPTQPESSAGRDPARHAAAIKAMLANWNGALQHLHPLPQPDSQLPLILYGEAFRAGERKPIPEQDLPAGTPSWMGLNDGWAVRPGRGLAKRATIAVTVPSAFLP